MGLFTSDKAFENSDHGKLALHKAMIAKAYSGFISATLVIFTL